MSRVSIADRARLMWFALRRGLTHAMGRLASARPTEWLRLSGRNERIAIAPQSLRTADPTRASEIYAGRFVLAGKIVVCDGRSPFAIDPPSPEWAEALLGFGWLHHLRAAESTITRANARALVDEWIGLQGGFDRVAWRPEILSRRVIVWLTQASVILADADLRFYRRFLRSLNRQVRFLRWTAGDVRDGVPRLRAHIALTCAALCMTGQIGNLRRASHDLAAELDRQILADGGHVTRNPGALIELLADLLPLGQAFTARNVVPPAALLNAIDRMMPMLRFFRHSDGAFALFNGMGPTAQDLLATILAYDDARGTPVSDASHSGYQRLEAGDTIVLMDTGRPPPLTLSAEAHAGCLAFELSSRQCRIVVNCGMPGTGRTSWRSHARSTRAHSTVTFNDASSCGFLETRLLRPLFGTPLIGGPRRVKRSHDTEAHAVRVSASHDGYAERFGVVHQRNLRLGGDGWRLDGEDVFLPARGEELSDKHPDVFAVRFHLHPSVRVAKAADGRGATLTLPNRDVWVFEAFSDLVDLEESVYLGGRDGPRRTVQLVIHGQARRMPRVAWSFALLEEG